MRMLIFTILLQNFTKTVAITMELWNNIDVNTYIIFIGGVVK